YEVSEADAGRVSVGSRVLVPFHGRRQLGIVVGPGSALPDGVAPRVVAGAPDATPVVDAEILALCRWIATYYAAPLGIVLRAALPAALTGAHAPVPSARTERIVVQRRELPSLAARDQAFARAPRQRALFELVESLGGRAPVAHLTERLKFTPSVLR